MYINGSKKTGEKNMIGSHIYYFEKITQLGLSAISGLLFFALFIPLFIAFFIGGFTAILRGELIPIYIALFLLLVHFIYTLISYIVITVTDKCIILKAFPLQQSEHSYFVAQVDNVTIYSRRNFFNPFLLFSRPYLFNQLGYQKNIDMDSYTYSIITDGVIITFKNGQKLFIGSYYPSKLIQAIMKAKGFINGLQEAQEPDRL